MVDPTNTKATTKHVVVANKRLGPFIAGFVFIVGVYLVFAVHWLLGLIVIIGSMIGIGAMMSQYAKDSAAEFEASCQQHRVTYKPNYSDPEREFFLAYRKKMQHF